MEETDDRGRKTRTTEARDDRRGIPQGSPPISPLLATIYMRRFVLGWKKLGLEQRLGSRIVTYADDLVILCKKGNADQALQQLRKIMSKLEAHLGQRGEDTRSAGSRKGSLDFLGYTFGRMFSERTGQARLGYRPSKKSIKRMVEKNPRTDGPNRDMARNHKAGGQGEPRTLRGLGELLPSRHRQQGVSGTRQLHSDAVAPVVAVQAQNQATQGRDLSTSASLRALWARTPEAGFWARCAVGEGVKFCPRAGCLSRARPVR